VRYVADPHGDYFVFDSPSISATASVILAGTVGEDVGNWTLGFVQLKYIGTNHARYRGKTVRDGSVFVTGSNKTLCRDTDENSPEVWYDPLHAAYQVPGDCGTTRLAQGTVIPPSKSLNVSAHMSDQPRRLWRTKWSNTVVQGQPDNFLHYAVDELLFCTMLVAQDPAGTFHMLKHFYWNVIWEHTFRHQTTGHVVADRAIRLQQNVQRPHDGNPHDSKFSGKEYDLSLPISNRVTRAPLTAVYAHDWAQG